MPIGFGRLPTTALRLMVTGASCVGDAATVGAGIAVGLAGADGDGDRPIDPGVGLGGSLDDDAEAGLATKAAPLGVAWPVAQPATRRAAMATAATGETAR